MLDIVGTYTWDDMRLVYNVVYLVNSTFKCSDPVGNIASEGDDLLELHFPTIFLGLTTWQDQNNSRQLFMNL